MRAVTDDFNESLHSVGTTFARLWTITRKDGNTIYLTDCDTNVLLDGKLFIASVGFTSTAVMTSSQSIGSQNVELTVPLIDLGITEADLRRRLYEEAKAELRVVDYDAPDNGSLLVFSGTVGRVVMSDKHRATVEVISFTDPNVFIADETYSSTCRNDLGDNHCTINIFSMQTAITVTTLIDTMAFKVDTMNGQADDFYALGQIKWLTGDNKGIVSDVRTTSLGLLSVGLFYPLPFPIKVGDTGQMLPGCDKQLSTCFKKFNNVLNFRGEPFAPSFSEGITR